MQAHNDERDRPGSFTFSETLTACDVCGGDSFVTLDRVARVVQCRRCGYRFVNPRPSQGEIAASYSDPNFYDGWLAADAGRLRMWRKRLAIVQKVATGPNLLDVGAGIGTFLALARDDAGWNVTGTEVSRSALTLCRERHGIELLPAPAEDLDLPPASIDTITLWHVLEHVPSPSRLLRACHRALAPGGMLVVAVPNDADDGQLPRRLKDTALRLVGRPRAPQPRYEVLRPGSEIHLSHFTPAVLLRLLTSTGFQTRQVTVDDHYPEPSLSTALRVTAYRWIMRLTGRNLGAATLAVAAKRDRS